jgi:hypothetical protein
MSYRVLKLIPRYLAVATNGTNGELSPLSAHYVDVFLQFLVPVFLYFSVWHYKVLEPN